MIEADFLVVVSIVGDEAHAMTPERAANLEEALEEYLGKQGTPLGLLPGTFSVKVLSE